MEKPIPRPDPAFDIFQSTIHGIINEHLDAPEPWGYSQIRFDKLNALKLIWDATWFIAKNKGMRNSADVNAKNAARKEYEADLRLYFRGLTSGANFFNNSENSFLPIRITLRSNRSSCIAF